MVIYVQEFLITALSSVLCSWKEWKVWGVVLRLWMHLHSISDGQHWHRSEPVLAFTCPGAGPCRGRCHPVLWPGGELNTWSLGVWDVGTLWHQRSVPFNRCGSTGEEWAGGCCSRPCRAGVRAWTRTKPNWEIPFCSPWCEIRAAPGLSLLSWQEEHEQDWGPLPTLLFAFRKGCRESRMQI